MVCKLGVANAAGELLSCLCQEGEFVLFPGLVICGWRRLVPLPVSVGF